MSAVETKTIDFSDFDRPNIKSPQDIGFHLIDLVSQHIEYDENIYRPDMALEFKKGNCYAWSQLGAIALDSWNIPSAIVLSRTHAHLVANVNNSIVFIDTSTGHVNDTEREADYRSGLSRSAQLKNIYRKLIPKAFKNDRFSLLFYEAYNGERLEWRGEKVDSLVPDRSDLIDTPPTTHVIFDTSQAADTLQAIGDLKRYAQSKPDVYEEKYDELRQYVPAFMQSSRDE